MEKQNTASSSTQKGVEAIFERQSDIVTIIREDHRPLKELIEVMKDQDRPLEERVRACTEFAPLLLTHAKAEEKALYNYMKTQKDLRMESYEGETEHAMADQLVEEIKRSSDNDQIGAKIKVLAEAVEHHIEEEEKTILPHVEKLVKEDTLKQLTKIYNQVQAQLIAEGQDDSAMERQVLQH